MSSGTQQWCMFEANGPSCGFILRELEVHVPILSAETKISTVKEHLKGTVLFVER